MWLRMLPALLLIVSAVAAAEIVVKDGKVTADVNAMPLKQVMQKFEQQADIRLVLDDSLSGQSISANFQDLPVALAVKKLLEGTGVNYVVLGNEEGVPQSIFVGGSETAGGPPKRLDGRPVSLPNRGVVTPVAPGPPVPAVPPPKVERDVRPGQQPQPTAPQNDAGVNVPTGGGFVPGGSNPPPQPQPGQPAPPPENPDDPNQTDDETDEER